MQTHPFHGLQSTVENTSSSPLVSVIVPFLNASSYLEEAIESVLAQTYEQWELLLVDDGSIDGSSEVAKRYAEKYPEKALYLEHGGHENRGVSASRNLGVRHAQGVYIAPLDADDVWLPQKLERQVAIMGSHPAAAMVYGNTLWWYSWTGNPQDSQRDFLYELGVPPDSLAQPPKLVDLFFFRQEAALPSPSSVLVRHEVVDRLGGFEEDFRGVYGPYEDQAFFAKVSLAEPVFASSECWSRYRQHSSSACSIAERCGQEYAARLFFMNWLAGYLVEQEVDDVVLWKAVEKETRRCRHPRTYRLLQRMKQTAGLTG